MILKTVKSTGRYLINNSAVLFFAIYFIVALIFIPGFSNAANLKTVFIQASFLSIVSFGLTFVFMNGGIDFSIIGIMGFSSIIGASIMKAGDGNVYVLLAVLVMLGIGFGVGCLNGLSVLKLKMPSFIATMASQMIFAGIAVWFTKSASISDLPPDFVWFGQTDILGIPMPVLVAAAIGLITAYVLHRSVFGRHLMAIGTNQKASLVSGLPVKKTIFTVFIISGVLASVASIMMTAKVASGIPTLGQDMIMDTVAAVVIVGTSLSGGKGTILGTALGAILVIMLNNSLYLIGLEWYVINIFKGIMVLMVALIDIRQNRQRAL